MHRFLFNIFLPTNCQAYDGVDWYSPPIPPWRTRGWTGWCSWSPRPSGRWLSRGTLGVRRRRGRPRTAPASRSRRVRWCTCWKFKCITAANLGAVGHWCRVDAPQPKSCKFDYESFWPFPFWASIFSIRGDWTQGAIYGDQWNTTAKNDENKERQPQLIAFEWPQMLSDSMMETSCWLWGKATPWQPLRWD